MSQCGSGCFRSITPQVNSATTPREAGLLGCKVIHAMNQRLCWGQGLSNRGSFNQRLRILRRFAMGKRLVVVGGGAGGPSAAAKAKRLDPDLDVTILEAGEYVSFST
jgi:hypothetical protein